MRDPIREIKDRFEIQDLLHRYAEMVDRRAWDRMDDIFAPGATIDYTSTGGVAGDYRETLQWLDRALAPWPMNLHFISNIMVELLEDRGLVYLRASTSPLVRLFCGVRIPGPPRPWGPA